MRTSTRVVVGVDGSMAGLRALRLAVAQAQLRHAELHALRAWTFRPKGRGGMAGYDEQEYAVYESTVAAFADAMGGAPADLDLVLGTVLGPPGKALVQYADREEDLLVVGSSQVRSLRRLFHPPVARYCAAHAACPVLVVPPDGFAKQARREGMGRSIRRDLPQFIG
ncbi:universal stress protein [Dactylosporangium sp. NBC_01737]|uniref:universal stress protein n=1 Tax=Dactylosporangium sp. NBC_01737 TaxID=2975959 RepID=UPI002E1335A7|nr:universal stress protein [Dactylosporangium sp. NBC_01737]